MSNVTGIKSGFMPVAAGASQIPVFSVLVNDTNPIWLYCGQVGHCEKGMSMVINENASSNKTLEAYQAAAAMLPVAGSSISSSMSMGGMMSSSSSMMSMPSSTPMMTMSGMVPTSIPTVAPTPTKSGPAVFTGAANREVVGSSPLVGLLVAGLALVL